jgi:hypothetical protein
MNERRRRRIGRKIKGIGGREMIEEEEEDILERKIDWEDGLEEYKI